MAKLVARKVRREGTSTFGTKFKIVTHEYDNGHRYEFLWVKRARGPRSIEVREILGGPEGPSMLRRTFPGFPFI
jgi:hypothetical protein